jgi:hypothetical protein
VRGVLCVVADMAKAQYAMFWLCTIVVGGICILGDESDRGRLFVAYDRYVCEAMCQSMHTMCLWYGSLCFVGISIPTIRCPVVISGCTWEDFPRQGQK